MRDEDCACLLVLKMLNILLTVVVMLVVLVGCGGVVEGRQVVGNKAAVGCAAGDEDRESVGRSVHHIQGLRRDALLTTTDEEDERGGLVNSMDVTDEEETRDRPNVTLSHALHQLTETTGGEKSVGSSSTDPLLIPYGTTDEVKSSSTQPLTPRFMGIDVGDESTNFQAGMWLLGLVVMLASAIPAVFLDTTLGFRRKRRRRRRETGGNYRHEDQVRAMDNILELVLITLEEKEK